MELPPTIESVGEVILVGGDVDKTSACLRFCHDDLDPTLITRLLHCEPTYSQRKGELLPSKRYQRVALTGSWLLNTPRGDGRELEEQISGLLDQVSDDLSGWDQLPELSRRDVFCGLHLKAWNRGFSLSAALMRRLGERNLTVEADIYCNAETETELSPA